MKMLFKPNLISIFSSYFDLYLKLQLQLALCNLELQLWVHFVRQLLLDFSLKTFWFSLSTVLGLVLVLSSDHMLLGTWRRINETASNCAAVEKLMINARVINECARVRPSRDPLAPLLLQLLLLLLLLLLPYGGIFHLHLGGQRSCCLLSKSFSPMWLLCVCFQLQLQLLLLLIPFVVLPQIVAASSGTADE